MRQLLENPLAIGLLAVAVIIILYLLYRAMAEKMTQIPDASNRLFGIIPLSASMPDRRTY